MPYKRDRRKPTTGIGLGLGIVKRLIQLYGGAIEVKAEVGEGATFISSFPGPFQKGHPENTS
jgi:signal transduction histidine kinase